ncbi:NrsF family protein [Bradyrhizobium erythrophlei]|uniref:NrsF family protein n=1 Tax=Bradyrhizobium erythrophlei TaxID=1437360 RepID=UPI0035EB391E
MIKTPDLIASLAANATPVRRLRPPVIRATCWLLLAAVILTLLAINQGIRPDLVERLREPAFAVSMAAALLTGVLATVAAFLVSLPDRSRLWLLLPVPALVVWLSNVGYQCLVQWVAIGPDGISLGEAARCFATLVLTGLPLSLAMLVMLRYAAPLRPTAATFMGSLAVAAITATALSLFHTIDATLMILMWNFGTAILFVGLAGVFGRRMFRWVAPRTFDAQD